MSTKFPSCTTANVEVQGPDDKAILRKPIPVSAMGTASGDFTLPKDAGLGFYSVQIKAGESPRPKPASKSRSTKNPSTMSA